MTQVYIVVQKSDTKQKVIATPTGTIKNFCFSSAVEADEIASISNDAMFRLGSEARFEVLELDVITGGFDD